MAERAVKSVIQGARAVPHNSGMGHEWWEEAALLVPRLQLRNQTSSWSCSGAGRMQKLRVA
eukprot:8129241-Pyramimonas_sp.AAC.1